MSEMSFPEPEHKVLTPEDQAAADLYDGGPFPEPEPAREEPKPEDLDPDIQELVNQARVLAANNNDLMVWLSQQGAEITGLPETRHEMIFAFLNEIGIVSTKARALFEVRWGRYLNETLNDLKKKADAHIENAKSEQLRRTLLEGVPGAHAAQMLGKNHRPKG